ncbi:putative transposase [Streptomyces sp. MJP52]|nr:putative transposase [Streptomyces sp. MJP52]
MKRLLDGSTRHVYLAAAGDLIGPVGGTRSARRDGGGRPQRRHRRTLAAVELRSRRRPCRPDHSVEPDVSTSRLSEQFPRPLSLLGSVRDGESASSLTRLTTQWQADHAAFMDRDLMEVDYVYVWADGIHLNVRLGEAKACVLVLIGVRADGSKELVAIKDGYRESAESWADLLRDCARRGMRAPSWRSVMAPWASGRPWPRCSLTAASRGAGFTKRSMSSTPCRSPRNSARRRPSRRSATPSTASMPRRRSRRSPSYTARSFPRPSRRSPMTRTNCWRSMTFRPSTGSPADHQPHWVDLLHRPAADQGHPRSRLPHRRPGDGLQAPRVRPAAVAGRERPHLVAFVRGGARFERGHLVERPEARAA